MNTNKGAAIQLKRGHPGEKARPAEPDDDQAATEPLAALGFVFDVSCWPVLQVRVPPVPVDEDVLRAFLAELASHHSRGRFGIVYDVPRFVLPNAAQRRILGDATAANQARFPSALQASAVATQGSVAMTTMGGIVRAITWVMPPSQPVRIFGDVDAAITWVRSKTR